MNGRNAMHAPSNATNGRTSALHTASDSAVATHDPSPTLMRCVDAFLVDREGQNYSLNTLASYGSDLRQFVTWLASPDVAIFYPHEVKLSDISAYLAALSRQKRSGVTRARKLAAIRKLFDFLVRVELLHHSPAARIETPRKEQPARASLERSEYDQLLSLAGANPRDYAILMILLQTGLRAAELCALELGDVDLVGKTLTVRAGKGNKGRVIELVEKAMRAIANYLRIRPATVKQHVFLTYQGAPLGRRGLLKLVTRYGALAGLSKTANPRTLRRTFATHKANAGVNPEDLQEWMGHADYKTTKLYIDRSRRLRRKAMEATSL